MEMKVASLFSGIGGIDLGFQQAGFNIVWANEIDKEACVTYRNNLDASILSECDIKTINPHIIPDFDILVAGFPCQSFSIAGRKLGFKDPRGNLFFEISRFLDIKRPKIVFLENVANLIEHDNGKTFLVIYNTLAQFGYAVKYKVIDSQQYGNVPQARKRIYIVGFQDYEMCAKFKFPCEIKLEKTLNDIIIHNKQHSECYYYNSSNFYYEELLKKVKDKSCIYKINDDGVSSRKYSICPTLTANMGTFPDRVPIILDDFGIRRITPQECLLLQGFPDSYKFSGISLNGAYKQCGNTVTVSVIKRIADQIIKLYK